MFQYEPIDELEQVLLQAGSLVSTRLTGTLEDKAVELRRRLLDRLRQGEGNGSEDLGSQPLVGQDESTTETSGDRDRILAAFRDIGELITAQNHSMLIRSFRDLFENLAMFNKRKEEVRTLAMTVQSRTEMLQRFTADDMILKWGSFSKQFQIQWGDKYLCQAFLAFAKADSITVDPHKLGFVPYPCGVVAFRNDRVRHFILQRAPYITASSQNAAVHLPPRHSSFDASRERRVVIESFAPFILEGSRPGSAAASLWLSTRLIPLTMQGHGRILRASLLAARELYEWLRNWGLIMQEAYKDQDHRCPFEFLPITADPPDTNLVCFVAKQSTAQSLSTINRFSRMVYERFTIQAELGDRDYSYSQPFFLSMTVFRDPHYRFERMAEMFADWGLSGRKLREEYAKDGLVVLRATVMSPYIHPLKKQTGYNYVKYFVEELAKAARECAAK